MDFTWASSESISSVVWKKGCQKLTFAKTKAQVFLVKIPLATLDPSSGKLDAPPQPDHGSFRVRGLLCCPSLWRRPKNEKKHMRLAILYSWNEWDHINLRKPVKNASLSMIEGSMLSLLMTGYILVKAHKKQGLLQSLSLIKDSFAPAFGKPWNASSLKNKFVLTQNLPGCSFIKILSMHNGLEWKELS